MALPGEEKGGGDDRDRNRTAADLRSQEGVGWSLAIRDKSRVGSLASGP